LFILGFLTYQGLLRRIAGRSDFMQILLTLGIALILIDSMQLVFGADFRQVNVPLRATNFRFQGIAVNASDLVGFAIALAMAVGMFLFVMKSRFGRAVRAIAQNPYAAPLVGIDLHRVQAIAFGMGIAAVGIAGGLLLPVFYLYPGIGEQFTLKAFVMVVLGGM